VNFAIVNQVAGQSFWNSTDVPNCAMFFWTGLTSASALPTANFQPYAKAIFCVSAQTVTYPALFGCL